MSLRSLFGELRSQGDIDGVRSFHEAAVSSRDNGAEGGGDRIVTMFTVACSDEVVSCSRVGDSMRNSG